MSDHPVIEPGQPSPPNMTPPNAPSPPTPGLSADAPPSSYSLLPDRPASAPIIMAWGAVVTYEEHPGVGYSPVAGPPGTPPATWQIHAPYTLKTVTWVAQAIGGKPELPSADTGSANERLLYKKLSPQVPQVNQDGLAIWTVGGSYHYMLNGCPGPNDSLGVGSHPLSVLPPQLNTLVLSDFKQLLAAAVVS